VSLSKPFDKLRANGIEGQAQGERYRRSSLERKGRLVRGKARRAWVKGR